MPASGQENIRRLSTSVSCLMFVAVQSVEDWEAIHFSWPLQRASLTVIWAGEQADPGGAVSFYTSQKQSGSRASEALFIWCLCVPIVRAITRFHKHRSQSAGGRSRVLCERSRAEITQSPPKRNDEQPRYGSRCSPRSHRRAERCWKMLFQSLRIRICKATNQWQINQAQRNTVYGPQMLYTFEQGGQRKLSGETKRERKSRVMHVQKKLNKDDC